MTSPSEQAAIAQWARTWRLAGPALSEIERRELREMTHADWQRAVAAVLSLPAVSVEAPATSGLIEQQKWFKKIYSASRS